MTVLTMRYPRGHFVVTGPDIEPLTSRHAERLRTDAQSIIPARPSIKEIGANAVKRAK
jgi:hypothetical protein